MNSETSNVVLQVGNGIPFMQGDTSLPRDKTIMYDGEKSLACVCQCGKPFAESVMEVGIVLDSVTCSNCHDEMAHIVNI